MGEFEGDECIIIEAPNGIVDDKNEGDETENHELSVQNFDDGLKMMVASVYPVFEAMKEEFYNEREADEDDDEPF